MCERPLLLLSYGRDSDHISQYNPEVLGEYQLVPDDLTNGKVMYKNSRHEGPDLYLFSLSHEEEHLNGSWVVGHI